MELPPRPSADLWTGLAIATLSGVALSVWRSWLGLFGALGTDAALWGLTARDLMAGAPPLVPPGYPALIAAPHIAGLDLISAGVALSIAAAAAVPAAAWWTVRAAGGTRFLAAVAAGAGLLLPDVIGWSQQLQPDSLTTLLVVALGGLLLGAANGSSRAAWCAAALAGVSPLVREHGVPLAVLGAIGLTFTGPQRRWPRVLAVAITWWLSPLLVGIMPGPHPLAVPWGDRAGGALAAFTATSPDDLPFLRELHRDSRRAYLDLIAQDDRLGQLRWHAQRSWQLAADGWAWLAIGVLAAARGWVTAARSPQLRRGLVVLALPLVAALPALIIWSQRRHVMLVVPLAMVLIVVGTLQASRRWRGLFLALCIVPAARWPGAYADLAIAQRSERHRADHFARIGAHLAQNAPAGSLLGGVFQDVGLYYPLPRHDPDGTPADWSTWLVSDRPPPPSAMGTWQAVFRVEDPPQPNRPVLSIYRLDPDRLPRPCAGMLPYPTTPYLAVDRAHALLQGCAGAIPPR